MTDRDKLIALLEEFGIEPKLENFEAYYPHGIKDRYQDDQGEWQTKPATPVPAQGVIIEGDYNKVVGYSDFYSRWMFTPEGKFINVGHWE